MQIKITTMKIIQTKSIWIALCLLVLITSVKAVELDSKNRDPKYVETIVGRSQKIVDKLNLKDKTVARNVLNIVSNRYFELNDIFSKRDTTVNRIKRSALKGEAKNSAQKAAQNEKEAALYRSHFAFPANLSLYLNEAQVEAVKDGITFGVVKVTYDATLEMVPTLKEEEKTQILAWLKEGREFALDAETSNKKHEAFGKYKGRINNYLSKQGYDLVKEREGWYARIKAREEAQKK
jgi:acylphosphatase